MKAAYTQVAVEVDSSKLEFYSTQMLFPLKWCPVEKIMSDVPLGFTKDSKFLYYLYDC
jgi:hypothetical protein